MLTLCLRTDKPEAELYLYKGQKKLAEIKWEAHRKLADTLNLKIEEILTLQGDSLQDIEKICVYQGPGSFTGLRIGLTVANTLSYALGIPIVGSEGESWLVDCLNRGEVGNEPVPPIYGREANITKPKK